MLADCACKGIRSCGLCVNSERVLTIKSKKEKDGSVRYDSFEVYAFNPKEGQAYHLERVSIESSIEELHNALLKRSRAEEEGGMGRECAEKLGLPGITLIENFLSTEEERLLIERIDLGKWIASQSGRRKQDYGPAVNFKRHRVKLDGFEGLPDYTDTILDKMRKQAEHFAELADFYPVELCNLEYEQARSSCIDLHKDDSWIWGERLVSVNLLSDCVMTLVDEERMALFLILLPRRSLLVMGGHARYNCQHGIFPHHVKARRLVLTMRELAPSFVHDQSEAEDELTQRSLKRIRTV